MTSSANVSIDENSLKAAADRVAARCDELAQFSERDDQLARTFCTPAMAEAHGQLRNWMESAELECTLDAVGNLIGQSDSVGSTKPVLMIGSHLDTVYNAGRFDGMLGLLLGLGASEVIRESGIELPFDIHVVAFSEEEGVRYRAPFIGSLGIAGLFEGEMLDIEDENGITLGDALKEFGCDGEAFESASYANRKMIGFIEAHIEQAVVLEKSGLPVGVVSAIAGQTRAIIEFKGQAGHAGTVPHDLRRDALAATAELLLKIEHLGQETDGLFATVGNIDAFPGLSNVISGRAELRLDLRHESDQIREDSFRKVVGLIKDVAGKRNVDGLVAAVQHTPAIPMDETLTKHLTTAVSNAGHEPLTMVSGAGHDAMIMANIAPSCMLFIRCREGISHHPDEYVSPEDIRTSLGVLVNTIIGIAQHN